MELSTADQYYLKALDYYPYNLECAVENLNYALSSEDKHAQTNCLLGKIYMYYLKDYDRAGQCFYNALVGDANYPDTYKHYSLLRIWEREYDRALKIIARGMTITGMDISILLMHKSLIHEWKMELSEAKKLLKQARLISTNEKRLGKIDGDLKRLKKKISKLRIDKKSKKKSQR